MIHYRSMMQGKWDGKKKQLKLNILFEWFLLQKQFSTVDPFTIGSKPEPYGGQFV